MYEGIHKACLEVALDNGGINRYRSVAKQTDEFNIWISTQDIPNIKEIDTWFLSLSEEELNRFCTWPEEERADIISPAFADDLLTDYFNEVC